MSAPTSPLIPPSQLKESEAAPKYTGPDDTDAVDAEQTNQDQGSPTASVKSNSTKNATEVTPVSMQVIAALNTWINGLSGPQKPPFFIGAPFPDQEWTHLFQLLAVATTLASALALAGNISPTLFHPSVDGKSLSAVTYYGCFAVLYSLYARIFRIVISIRQSLFCFGLITAPWFPLFILLKATGWHLGFVLWFSLLFLLVCHIMILLVRAIHIVSGASLFQVILSFVIAAGLAIGAVLTTGGSSEAAITNTSPQFAPAAPSPNPSATTPAENNPLER